jgi:hypothetical protein
MAFHGVMGKNAIAAYNSATYSTPTWVTIVAVRDVSVSLGKNMGTVTSRETDWELKGAGFKTASVTFGYLHEPTTDTVFDALLDSYIADTPVDMIFSDGAVATTGNQGLRAHFIVSDMSQSQDMEEPLMFDFTIDVTRFDDSGTLRNPQWWSAS